MLKLPLKTMSAVLAEIVPVRGETPVANVCVKALLLVMFPPAGLALPIVMVLPPSVNACAFASKKMLNAEVAPSRNRGGP